MLSQIQVSVESRLSVVCWLVYGYLRTWCLLAAVRSFEARIPAD
jgi:hypothetical protein